jgi:hypothetical protein
VNTTRPRAQLKPDHILVLDDASGRRVTPESGAVFE